MNRVYLTVSSALLCVVLVASCTEPAPGGQRRAGDRTRSTSSHDAQRTRWARFIRGTVQPRLTALGVSPWHIKRAAWFGLSEGIFTVATNQGYGQPGGPQSPLGFSNCGDDAAINTRTALPDCFGAEGYRFRSGNWQVGIAGAQVSDSLAILPKLYRRLYGNLPPRRIGQSVLGWLGEGWRTFPDLSIEQVATRANARWASVIIRDPALNVYIQTHNSWIRDGRHLGYGEWIIDAVWSEAQGRPGSLYFPQTDKHVVGTIAETWLTGDGRWACWPEYETVCLATWGYPLEGEIGVKGSIAGGGERISHQLFERARLERNWYPDRGEIVEGALLGSRALGKPGDPSRAVDPAFAAYHARYGGLPVFGWPLGPAHRASDGRLVQVFERARLEENPGFDPLKDDPVWEVLRGLLGSESR